MVDVGNELFDVVRRVDRESLVRYAGASGDFNPIHWNDRVATEVGLGGVIAHGMLTMGIAGSVLTDHLGDVGKLESYGVRFTRPVPVPDPGAAELRVVGVVAVVEDSRYRVDLTVSVQEQNVLGRAQAWVRY